MKIFLLKRLDSVEYDQYIGFVISAKDEISARSIAGDIDGKKSRWIDHHQTSCKEIKQDEEEGVILSSYLSG